MTTIGDYALIQYTNQNRIIIYLPQTLDTLTTTTQIPSNRRIKLTDAEEAALLVAVKAMFENGRKDDD